jgi:hypothetical protein
MQAQQANTKKHNMNNTTKIEVNDRISYTDEHGDRAGTVIELNNTGDRARIKWDLRKSRTWIRINALKKLPI